MNIYSNEIKVEVEPIVRGTWVKSIGSWVKVTHIPSGLSATSHSEYSQHRNRQVAIDKLVIVLRERLPRIRKIYVPAFGRYAYWADEQPLSDRTLWDMDNLAAAQSWCYERNKKHGNDR